MIEKWIKKIAHLKPITQLTGQNLELALKYFGNGLVIQRCTSFRFPNVLKFDRNLMQLDQRIVEPYCRSCIGTVQCKLLIQCQMA